MLWSAYHNDVLSRGEVTSNPEGYLDYQKSIGFFIYHTSSNDKILQIIRNIKHRVNGGSYKPFIHKKHTE